MSNLSELGPPLKKIKIRPKFYKSYYLQNILIEYLKENPENNNSYYLVKYRQQLIPGENGGVHPTFIPLRDSVDLDYLLQDQYDVPQIYNSYIPFSIINKMIPMDMEIQLSDSSNETLESNSEICPTDSSNWYKDSEILNVGDILIDYGNVFSRGDAYPFIVVEHNGEKCLLGFVLSSGDYERGFLDGDCINSNGEAIHPLNGSLVKLKFS